MDRRSFVLAFGPMAIAGVQTLGASRAAAQDSSQIISRIFSELAWKDSVYFESIWSLTWVNFELRDVYQNAFADHTGISHFDRSEYSEVLSHSMGMNHEEGLAQNVDVIIPILDENRDDLSQEFLSSFDGNVTSYLNWLESIGIVRDGQLAVGLLEAQAIFALSLLGQGGFKSLGERRATMADNSACWWPFPFC